MYCSSCGIELPESFRFCSQCGAATGVGGFTDPTGKPARLLSRPRDERKLAGVCAGVARYLGVDVTLVRVLVVCFAIWPPFLGLVFYIICWIVMPPDPLLLGPARPQDNAVANPAA
jgi:phage shock protein C